MVHHSPHLHDAGDQILVPVNCGFMQNVPTPVISHSPVSFVFPQQELDNV